MTLNWIIENKGTRLDEEWELMFEIVKSFISNKELIRLQEVVASLLQFFVLVRTLYVTGEYRGQLQLMMSGYENARYIICDPSFDALYLSCLRQYGLDVLEAKARDLLDLNKILDLRDQDEQQPHPHPQYDIRIAELLNAFEDIYLSTRDMDQRLALERAYLSRAKDFVESRRFMPDCALRVLRVLQTIAMSTTNFDHFAAVDGLLVRTIACAEERATSPSRRMGAATRSAIPDHTLPDEAHKCLFVQFHQFYLEYPPMRLACVLRAFTEILTTSHRTIKLLTLRFLSKLAYDSDFHVTLPAWGVPSYLCGLESELYPFPSQRIFNAASQFLRLDAGIDLVLQALDVLSTLCRSHYAFRGADVSQLIQALVQFLDTTISRREVEAAMKVVEILQLIMEQRNVAADPANMQVMRLGFMDMIAIFGAYLAQLEKLVGFFRTEIEEFKRSKAWKKVQSSPTRGTSFLA